MRTTKMRRAGISSVAVALAGLAMLVIPSTIASAAPSVHNQHETTCSSGYVFPGIYTSLLVIGSCQLTDIGTVVVLGDLQVGVDATFNGITNGRLVVYGDVQVDEGGTMDLGCNVRSFGLPCVINTHDVVYQGVYAHNPLEMVWHSTTVHGNYEIRGSIDNTNCQQTDSFGQPDYFTFEDGSVTGNLHYIGLHTCWLGLFRTRVRHNVVVDDNRTNTTIPGIAGDSPELASNLIVGGLYCSGNIPPPTFGDSHGRPNVALRGKFGQCEHL